MDRVANDRIAQPFVRADIADEHATGVDADARPKRVVPWRDFAATRGRRRACADYTWRDRAAAELSRQPANNGAITEFGRTRDQFSPSSNSPRSRPGCASSWRAGRSISASAGTAWRHWCSRRYVRTRFVGDVFVYRVKRADRVKILAWDGTGLCLFHKRLEKGHFVWPPVQDGRFA